MPPRGLTNPAPKTESALAAAKSFYCDLCGKGYSRINEFEAHEGSYDHLHKKRLKEMKLMSRDPLASTKARKAEKKANDAVQVINIKLSSPSTNPQKNNNNNNNNSGGGGFKKGGFRNAFGGDEKAEMKVGKADEVDEAHGNVVEGKGEGESEDEEGGYDPRRPTGCWRGCKGR